MKIKNLVFLVLIVGVISLSGCTDLFGGGTRSIDIFGVFIEWTTSTFEFIIGLPFVPKNFEVIIENLEEPQVMALLTLAFFTSWMIIYGFLSQLRIFGRRKNLLYLALSLLISIAGSITGLVPWVALLTYTVMNIWAIGIFALMFFVGTWFLYKKRKGEWGAAASVAAAYEEDVGGLKDELAQRRMELVDIRRRIAKTASPDRRTSMGQREQKIKDEIKSLKDRIQELAESYRS